MVLLSISSHLRRKFYRHPRSITKNFCFTNSSPPKIEAMKSEIWDPTVSLSLNHPLLVTLEKNCNNNEIFDQILAQMFRLSLTSTTFTMSRLINFCANSKNPDYLGKAKLLFDHFTPEPNLFIYNTMISVLSCSLHLCTRLYNLMIRSFIFPDEQTFIRLLKSCESVLVGLNLHAHVIVSGFSLNSYVQNSLIKMYLEFGKITRAREVFDQMLERDSFSYNIMISGYAGNGLILEALELFKDMLVSSGVEPDEFTMVSLLLCSGRKKSLTLGKSVHGWIIRRISYSDSRLVLGNALLDMYAKCEEMEIALRVFMEFGENDAVSWNILISGFANLGELDLAKSLFEKSKCKDLISWNSLLAGYAKKGDHRKAIELFYEMIAEKILPDKVTFVSLTSVVEEMGILEYGRSLHGWLVKAYGICDAFLGSALINMYCKCGSLEKAFIVFEMVIDKDLALWTSMINGLAFHGYGKKAIELFFEMQENGMSPNNVALLAVLTACVHAGLVDEGYKIFKDMKLVHSVEPGIEHYGCLVDLLARSGRIDEAKTVIEMMPINPTRSMWGSIINACKVYGNLEVAETAVDELLKLHPEEEGGYVLLSNVYASSERWSYSDSIRGTMDRRGLKKIAGCSSVIIDGIVHDFYSSDKRHHHWFEIYLVLWDLHRQMQSGIMTWNHWI